MAEIDTPAETIDLLSLDFDDPALTAKALGRLAADAGIDEDSATALEFYRRGSDRFIDHAPFAFDYASSHLKAGLVDDALIGLTRALDAGMPAGRILRDLREQAIAPQDFLPLYRAGIRRDATHPVARMLGGLIRDNLSAFRGPDGRIPLATLIDLEEIGDHDRGIAIATFAAAGLSEAAIDLLAETPLDDIKLSFESITPISVHLARQWALLIESGWLGPLCEQLAAIDPAPLVFDKLSCLVIGCALVIGKHPAGLTLLNRGCTSNGGIVQLRDRSIVEWLRDRRGIEPAQEERFDWERRILSPQGDKFYPVSAITKPYAVACMPDARLHRMLPVVDDSIIVRDSVFPPLTTAENMMIGQPGDYWTLIYVPDKTVPVTGDTILIGEHANFWHYLVNHIGKAAFAFGQEDYRDFNLLFFTPPPEGNLQLLERLGFSRDRVLILGGIKYVFERLWVASIPYSETWARDGAYVLESAVSPEPLIKARDAIQRGPVAMGGRRLYLSRRDAIHRRVENEDEVRALLENYGFEVAEMSALSVDEQCDLVRDAQIIVSVYGAQLTSAFFAPPGCHVIELMFERLGAHYHYELPAQILGMGYTKLCCDMVGPAGPTDIHAHPGLMVPLDLLRLAVEQVVGPKEVTNEPA